jgi:hypothetical protein
VIPCLWTLHHAHSEQGLFQNDNDLDTVGELGHAMGLGKLEKEMRAAAKASGKSDKEVNSIHLCIYGGPPPDGGSHPDVVRRHLDSGVLANFIKVKEARMMKIPDGSREQVMEFMFRDPCYEYVLLGACAMSLGCQLPQSFLDMLKLVYTEFYTMPDALKQMRKALFGPGGFKNGEPYDFKSKNLFETANSKPAKPVDKSGGKGFDLMNVFPPGGPFSTVVGNSAESAILKELRDKMHNPDVCAGCSGTHGEDGGALLQCSKCKDRKYCSVVCQKKHWKIHKKLCTPVVV